MPKKIREPKALLKRAGFAWRPGKGSHTNWWHPNVTGTECTVSGSDGDDAKRYQEKEIEAAIRRAGGSA